MIKIVSQGRCAVCTAALFFGFFLELFFNIGKAAGIAIHRRLVRDDDVVDDVNFHLFYKDDYIRSKLPMMPVIKGDEITLKQILFYSVTVNSLAYLRSLWQPDAQVPPFSFPI